MKTIMTMVLILFISTIQNAHAQRVSFEGEVRDADNVPIEFANVMALDTVKNSISAFAVTNREGMFKLMLTKDKPYRLKISFVGFEPFEVVFKAEDTSDSPLLIKLKPQAQSVEGVEVVQELPVMISGDTVTYKTEAFTDETERKLGDVLEKLPGFEVDENGEIKVQGKKVNKVLVEGKEFFEGDSKLATQNLPANAIDKVQVLRNFNDVAPLRGLGNDEQMALNIQLKEDKKNLVFGDITAGAGPEERYLGHANLFYYNPKTNVNLITGTNNIGQQTFTAGDFFRFRGGLTNLSRRSGSSFNVSNDDIGIPTANRTSARTLESTVGALNFNFNPNKKWRHSGFLIGAASDNTLGSISQRTYIRQSGDNQELLTSDTRVENTSGLLKYSARYTPNEALQVVYSAFGKISDLRNSNNRLSQFSNFDNEIRSTTTQQPLSVDQQLQAFYAPNGRDIFSLEATYQYRSQDPLYDLLTTERPFASLIPVGDGATFNLLQSRDVITHKQESALNYYRVLNKTNHINFKLGNSYNSQTLSSGIAQRRDGEEDQSFTDALLNNDVDFTFSDYFVGVMYKTKVGKLTLSPGLNLHRYHFSNRQLGTEEEVEKTLLLPEFFAKYNFRSSHSVTLRYSANAEFTDVQNVAAGLVIWNYNLLFGGNRNLQNSWYHQFDLGYFNFNMYNFFNIYGGVNYQRRFDGIANTIQFSGLERISTPVNIGVANEMLSGNIQVDKRFDKFRVNFRAIVTESVNNNVVSDVANQERSVIQNYRASLQTTFFKKLNWELGYNRIYNEYSGNNAANTFVTDRPYTNFNLRFLQGFRLDVDYEYNHYESQNTGLSQSYDLMNAALSYHKKKSKWEFKLEALNLLNTTTIRRDSFSESLISTFEYFIQQRYFLLSVQYDL